MTIDTILAELKERHGELYASAILARYIKSVLAGDNGRSGSGDAEERLLLRDYIERMIAAGIAATDGDSVAGLVRQGGLSVVASRLNGDYFYLFRLGEKWHIRGAKSPRSAYDDEATAVRAFREAAGMGEDDNAIN